MQGKKHLEEKSLQVIDFIRDFVEAREDGKIDLKEKIELGVQSIPLVKNWDKVFAELKGLSQVEVLQLKVVVEKALDESDDFDSSLVGQVTEAVFAWFSATITLYIVCKECFTSTKSGRVVVEKL